MDSKGPAEGVNVIRSVKEGGPIAPQQSIGDKFSSPSIFESGRSTIAGANIHLQPSAGPHLSAAKEPIEYKHKHKQDSDDSGSDTPDDLKYLNEHPEEGRTRSSTPEGVIGEMSSVNLRAQTDMDESCKLIAIAPVKPIAPLHAPIDLDESCNAPVEIEQQVIKQEQEHAPAPVQTYICCFCDEECGPFNRGIDHDHYAVYLKCKCRFHIDCATFTRDVAIRCPNCEEGLHHIDQDIILKGRLISAARNTYAPLEEAEFILPEFKHQLPTLERVYSDESLLQGKERLLKAYAKQKNPKYRHMPEERFIHNRVAKYENDEKNKSWCISPDRTALYEVDLSAQKYFKGMAERGEGMSYAVDLTAARRSHEEALGRHMGSAAKRRRYE